jgi:hypothetical protein
MCFLAHLDSCSAGTVCFELIKGVPAGVVALLVGALAAWIGYQQYRVGRAKLNLDLFDKRYLIFQKTWEFLSSPPSGMFATGPIDNLVPQASFLFGSEVADYMRTVSRHATELAAIGARARGRGDVIAPEDIPRDTELHNWFFQEASVGVKKIFGKYLDFSEWR